MKANETTLIELIGVRKRVFSIPVYQRNYDWKTDNCKQLFYDIQRIAESEKDHFLGTIVYIPDRSTATCPIFIIIDGQQRITSVMLFIKALHDIMTDENVRADIEEDYLRNRGVNEYRLKLKPIESDQNVYEKLMMQDEFNESMFTSLDKSSAIYRNYDLFKNLIATSTVEPVKLYEAVFRLEIVEIQLDKENPQEIFESLNSTGLDLSNADLLRNYLLMSLDYEKQQELYKKYWLSIEKFLGADQIEQFMTHYIILKKKSDSVSIDGKRAHINPSNLYRTYKMYLSDEIKNDPEYLENLLSDMKKYAGYYQYFVNFENENQEIDRKHQEIFTQFNSPAIAITLMYFYNLFDSGIVTENEYSELLDVCISYLFRNRVAGHNMGTQFAALLIQYYERSKEEKFIDRVWSAFNGGKGSSGFPSDSEFKNDLQTNELYLSLRAAGVRYLLYKLESKLSKEIVTIDNATIEHILPQTLSEKWRQYLGEKNDTSFDVYVHRLGNLTLTKENSKLYNNLFSEKRNEYAESNYKLTRGLAKYTDWTSKEIQARSVALSELALEIWKLPSKFNEEKLEKLSKSGIILSLEDDFELFNGTKPVAAMLFGESINTNNWSEVYTWVHEKLYSMDPSVYSKFVMTEDNVKEKILSDEKNAFTKSIRIRDGWFFLNTSCRNVKRMMRKLRLFIDFYSEQTKMIDGDIVEELIFQIA